MRQVLIERAREIKIAEAPEPKREPEPAPVSEPIHQPIHQPVNENHPPIVRVPKTDVPERTAPPAVREEVPLPVSQHLR